MEHFDFLGDFSRVLAIDANIPTGAISIVSKATGKALEPPPLEAWMRTFRVRNPTSHTAILEKDGFQEALGDVLTSGLLDFLIPIKRCLSSSSCIGVDQ